MSSANKLIIIVLTIIYVYILFVDDAYAYLDPGTGSYMLQMLLAALLSMLFFVKAFWSNVKLFFKRFFIKGK